MNVFANASAMRHLETWQSAVAENLAAGSQAGYKAIQVSLEKGAADASGKTIPLNASQERDFSPGPVRRTDRPLDVALTGEGFIVGVDPAQNRVLFRNGALQVNADGVLVSPNGMPIEGLDGPIQVVPNQEDPYIDDRGEVWQGSVSIGRLRVAQPENIAALQYDGSGWHVPNDGTVPLTDIDNPEIQPGFLEEGNHSPLRSMVALIQISRAFEANQKAIQAADESVEQTIRAYQ